MIDEADLALNLETERKRKATDTAAKAANPLTPRRKVLFLFN